MTATKQKNRLDMLWPNSETKTLLQLFEVPPVIPVFQEDLPHGLIRIFITVLE